jgi:hypothetical protein
MISYSPNRRRLLASLPCAALPVFSSHSIAASPEPQSNILPPSTVPTVNEPNVLLQPDGSAIITWGVNGNVCTGHVEYGTTAELGKTAKSGRLGMSQFDDQVLSVSLPRLHEGGTFYFRTVTVPLEFGPGIHMNLIKRKQPVASAIRSFTLPGPRAGQLKIAMWNDTHMNAETVGALRAATAAYSPDCVVMNGDIHDFNQSVDLPNACLRTTGGGISMPDWPMIFSRGNHDMRGYFAERLPQFLPPQANDGYYGVYRIGPVAMIILDTGEDNIERTDYGQLTECQHYREIQRDWLARAVDDSRISSAPFRIAFCHIPLRWSNMGATGEYSPWSADLFVPGLAKAGIQAVFSGHTHRFWHGTPSPQQPFHQIVGGGPQLPSATLTEISAKTGKLNIRVSSVTPRKPLLDLTLDPLC